MEKKLTQLIDKALSRRNFLVGSGTVAAAAVLVGCGDSSSPATTTPTPTTMAPGAPALMDADYLNFALNLEYLEAEYYLRGTTGNGLSSADAGSGAGTVTGGAQVTFTNPAYQNYANLIAQDELNHVRLIRAALGSSAIARPAIDLTGGFNAVASAAGIGASFDAFANEDAFFVGGFAFEDVGVTAYTGAAAKLTVAANLNTAAGLQAVEAYHAAILRAIIAGSASVAGASQDYLTAANKIITLRGTLGGGNETMLSINSIVAADSTNAIAFPRTPDQVLHIVYGAVAVGTKSGAFFPNGTNGNISVTTT